MSDQYSQPLSADTAINNMIVMLESDPSQMLPTLRNQVPIISKALDHEAAEYNQLVDIVTKRDTEITNLKEELSKLKQIIQLDTVTGSEVSASLEKAEAELIKLQDAHDEEMLKASQALSDLQMQLENHKALSDNEYKRLKNRLDGAISRETKLKGEKEAIETTLKELQALNPKRLSKKNKDLQKAAREDSATIEQLQNSLKSASTAISDKDKKIKELVEIVGVLKTEVEKQRERIDRYDGTVSNVVYEGKNGLKCYIFDFCWGLKTIPIHEQVKTVNDYDWHLTVRTNRGIGAIVSVTDWLVGISPECEELKRDWPTNINEAIEAIIIERSKTSHPHLVQRREWAQNEGIENVGLADKHVKLLKEGNFHSVYAVCHIPPERMAHMVKGMGLKTSETVYRRCRAHVTEWEKEHWTREQRGLN